MEFYERIAGARMHVNFYRPGVERRSLDKGIALDIADFCSNVLTTINETHTTLTFNKI
jgi:NADH:ubiquinone oxidoreductase subunit D